MQTKACKIGVFYYIRLLALFLCGSLCYGSELYDSALCAVSATGTHLEYLGVTAVNVSISGSDNAEQFFSNVFLGDISKSCAISGEVALLTEGDHLVDLRN